MIRTEWFTWLNIRRQPMISFSLFRDRIPGGAIEREQELILAFPPSPETEKYREMVHVSPQAEGCGGRISFRRVPDRPLLVPADSEIILCCTLSGAYNYPFKKTRIFNCDLERALSAILQEDDDPEEAAGERSRTGRSEV